MIVDENGMCTLSEEDCSYHSHTAKRTNADKIRSMSDEELAGHLICEHTICTREKMDCNACMLDWLKEEANE